MEKEYKLSEIIDKYLPAKEHNKERERQRINLYNEIWTLFNPVFYKLSKIVIKKPEHLEIALFESEIKEVYYEGYKRVIILKTPENWYFDGLNHLRNKNELIFPKTSKRIKVRFIKVFDEKGNELASLRNLEPSVDENNVCYLDPDDLEIKVK